MFCQMIAFAQGIVNLVFIGYLNNVQMMAGAGLGTMIQNMLGLSIMIGLNGGIETLVSQSYGVNKLKQCGTYLNRGRLVLFLFFIPMSFVLWNSKTILIAIN